MKSHVEVFERDARVLERIVSKYPEESVEYETLKRAAIALWYVLTERHEEFTRCLERWDSDLSLEEKQHLRKLGIDPDTDAI